MRTLSALLWAGLLLTVLGCSGGEAKRPTARHRHDAPRPTTAEIDYEERVTPPRRSAWNPPDSAAITAAPPADNPAIPPPAPPPATDDGVASLSPGSAGLRSPFVPLTPTVPDAQPAVEPFPPPAALAPPEELPQYAQVEDDPVGQIRGVSPKRVILSDDPDAPEMTVVPEEEEPRGLSKLQLPPIMQFTLRSEVGGDLPPAPELDGPDGTPVPGAAASPSPPSSGGGRWRELGQIGPPQTAGLAPSSAEHVARMPLIPSAAERMKDKDFEVVEVFYATDRKSQNEQVEPAGRVLERFVPAGISALFTTLLFGLSLSLRSRSLWAITGIGVIFTGGFTYYAGTTTHTNAVNLAKEGPRYGNERGELQTGICRVSIPRVHQIGKLEAPSIIRLEVKENEKKHVVLQGAYVLPEEEYFNRLHQRVDRSERREVFVFIHGYNVTFEDAARRTAQMHYDLDFQGAPIFYSWPSQGGLLQYTVDETNVAWTASHFKKFLLEVVQKSGARSINLIAHSMGNRALTSALRDIAVEMDTEQKLFNQVVLAAPDIDADIFQRDIVPSIRGTAEKLTLYASSNDQALIASKLVHGYPRAGESGENIVILPGVDTIDVSSVQTNFLGHSYYGDSDVILADVCLLLTESLPPQQRTWLIPAYHNKVVYWVFQGAQAVTQMPRTMR